MDELFGCRSNVIPPYVAETGVESDEHLSDSGADSDDVFEREESIENAPAVNEEEENHPNYSMNIPPLISRQLYHSPTQNDSSSIISNPAINRKRPYDKREYEENISTKKNPSNIYYLIVKKEEEKTKRSEMKENRKERESLRKYNIMEKKLDLELKIMENNRMKFENEILLTKK